MNIWYLNHYATPHAYGLPGRPYYLARSFASFGHEVTIVCASWHHLRSQPAPNGVLKHIILSEGVRYLHLPARPYKGNGWARLQNMLDYSKAIKHLEQMVKDATLSKPDLLIPSCVHLFSFAPAYALAKIFKAKLIYEVRDIWPLSLVELSDVPRWHPLILWMRHLEKSAYQKADAVVSLLPNALVHMQSRGLKPEKFNFIPNGVSIDEWDRESEPLPDEHLETFKRLRQGGKLIVVYTGAHGPPNALDQILDLAKINGKETVPYHFVLIGDGVEKTKLMQRVEEENLSFISFLPRIPKEQVPSSIRETDICFIGWQNKNIYRFGISPNKIGDYFMGCKPVLHAVNAGNDPVSDANAGISVEPYNPELLDRALRRFINMTESEREALGANGREYAMRNLEWEVLGKQYASICENLVQKV